MVQYQDQARGDFFRVVLISLGFGIHSSQTDLICAKFEYTMRSPETADWYIVPYLAKNRDLVAIPRQLCI